MNSKNRTIAGGIRLLWAFTMAALVVASLASPARADDPPDLEIEKTHSGTFTQNGQGTYTIKVRNIGLGETSGLVTVADTLPAGLTATSISGVGWDCNLGTLTCTRDDVLEWTLEYPPITLNVNVAVDAPALVTNVATVSGGGDVNPNNNTASDPTVVNQMPDLIITGYEFRNADNTEVITEIEPNQAFHIRLKIKNQGGAPTGLFYPGVFLNGKPNYGPDHAVFGRVTLFSDYRISPAGTLDFQEGCLYYDPDGTIDPLTQLIQPERGNYTRPQYNSELPAGASVDVDVFIGYPEAEFPDEDYDDIRTGLPAGNYTIHLYVDPNCSGGEVESNEYNNSFGPINLAISGSNGGGDPGGACTPPSGGPQVFADVPASHWAKDYVEAMYHCGLTAGCGTGPLRYCPETIMNRVESAVFILRGNFGSSYEPPAAPWTTFAADNWSPGTWATKWAEGLFQEGLTAGCGSNPLRFCPWDRTPRVQLAVFSLRLKHGNSYNPPAATGTVFGDFVNTNDWGTKWAEQAYLEGLIPACGTMNGKPMFCPNSLVSRALAAYSIVKAKGILP